jgi:hypothetical protein
MLVSPGIIMHLLVRGFCTQLVVRSDIGLELDVAMLLNLLLKALLIGGDALSTPLGVLLRECGGVGYVLWTLREVGLILVHEGCDSRFIELIDYMEGS